MRADTGALERFHPWPLRVQMANERDQILKCESGASRGSFFQTEPCIGRLIFAAVASLHTTNRDNRLWRTIEVPFPSTAKSFAHSKGGVTPFNDAQEEQVVHVGPIPTGRIGVASTRAALVELGVVSHDRTARAELDGQGHRLDQKHLPESEYTVRDLNSPTQTTLSP